MDEFVDFNFVLVDASHGPSGKAVVVERGPRRERVDVIARQFRDFLRQPAPPDGAPQSMMLTHDFKLRRLVGETAGRVTFLVARGAAAAEQLEEVALVAFARSDDAAGREVLQALEPYLGPADRPAAPFVVAVRLAPRVPSIISEWYGKSVAGFFAGRS